MVLHAAVHLHGRAARAHAGPVRVEVGAVVEPRHARASLYAAAWQCGLKVFWVGHSHACDAMRSGTNQPVTAAAALLRGLLARYR